LLIPSIRPKPPSNFYFFGKVKNQLIGRSTQDEKDLLPEVMEILGYISISELQDVFRNWMKRPESAIKTRGEYVS
jgi:hypothetical protein